MTRREGKRAREKRREKKKGASKKGREKKRREKKGREKKGAKTSFPHMCGVMMMSSACVQRARAACKCMSDRYLIVAVSSSSV